MTLRKLRGMLTREIGLIHILLWDPHGINSIAFRTANPTLSDYYLFKHLILFLDSLRFIS